MNTPTPRTDKNKFRISRKGKITETPGHPDEYVVLASEYATLEQELADANELLEDSWKREKDLYWRKQYEEACIAWGTRHEEWEAQLHAATAEADRLRGALKLVVDLAPDVEACNETALKVCIISMRDEARAALAHPNTTEKKD